MRRSEEVIKGNSGNLFEFETELCRVFRRAPEDTSNTSEVGLHLRLRDVPYELLIDEAQDESGRYRWVFWIGGCRLSGLPNILVRIQDRWTITIRVSPAMAVQMDPLRDSPKFESVQPLRSGDIEIRFYELAETAKEIIHGWAKR